MNTLFLDLETYNEKPIRDGTYAYAETAEITLAAFAWNDEPVSVLDFTDGDTLADLAAEIEVADRIVIQNSMFDRTVLAFNGIEIPIDKIEDTMLQAYCHGLPGSLDTLCTIFNVPIDQAKHKAGKELVQLFCKPRAKNSRVRRATRVTHPVEWQRFKEYAGSDVTSMRALWKMMPRWNYPDGVEYRRWVLDQKINDRGFAVDVELATQAVRACTEEQARLAARTLDLTNEEVERASQRDKLLAHILNEYGVDLPDLKKDTLERRITDEDLPWVVRELLAIRLQTATSSTSKYKSLLKAANRDGRLRGTLQFSGAQRTGRWAGRTFQPQNLPRPDMTAAAIEEGIEAIKIGAEALLYDPVMPLMSNAIRGTLVAGTDRKIVVSDLSNIEGRALAWLAGEQWKLDAFAAFDRGEGHDLYVMAYAKSFGVTPDVVIADKKAGGIMRQIGKVQELALGFQGALGAFTSMAAIYGVELPERQVLAIVRAWRAAHPAITSFWPELDNACRIAINVPDRWVQCRKVRVIRTGAWLRIVLPSGRALCYPSPKIVDDKITYMGMNPYSRRWTRLKTYGGKLVENVTQATACEILKTNMELIDDAGYSIVLTVHDEVIAEVPARSNLNDERLGELLATVPAWAKGLPLAAGGFEGTRYRKD